MPPWNSKASANSASTVYYGNALAAWTKALLTFALWFTVLPLARAFIARRLEKRESDQPVRFPMLVRTLIDSTTRVFMIAVATYLALRWLEIPPRSTGSSTSPSW